MPCDHVVLAAGLFVSAAVFLAVAFVFGRALAALLLASALFGAGIAVVAYQGALQVQAAMPEEAFSGAEAVLLEDSQDRGRGEQALCSVTVPGCPQATCTVRFGDSKPLYYGQRVKVAGSFSEVDLVEDDYAWRQGSCGTVKVSDASSLGWSGVLGAICSVRVRAIEAIGDADVHHALIQALVCGYRRSIRGSEEYTSYQSCGLAHLVAVSGAHLVIVTGLIASMLRAMGSPRKLSVPVLIAVMGSYLVLSGCPLSALRATVMSSVGIVALYGKRRPSALNALGVGVYAIVGANPAAAVSVSFTLSALSTAGIVLFAPLFQEWLMRLFRGRARWACEALALTFSASVLSQPYACSVFSLLPLVAPVANVVVGPLFPLVCAAGLAAGAFSVLGIPGAGVLVEAASLAGAVLDWLVGMMARIPFACVPFTLPTVAALTVSLVLASALWLGWRKLLRVAVAAGAMAIAVAVWGLACASGDAIVMFDVGQGDSLLVRCGGRSILIDTGNQDSKLREELARNHVVHLDALLVTHADDDHCGSIDVLQSCVQVDRVFLAAGMGGSDDEKARGLVRGAERLSGNVVELDAGDSFSCGCSVFEVVWPKKLTEDGGNADSLCVLMRYDGDSDGTVDCTALFTGDAESDQVAEMIADGSVRGVDILKVGHHGSKAGLTEDEASVLHPRIALIGVGARNRYGHPAQQTLDLLDSVGCTTFRTDLNGEVTCSMSATGVYVRCDETQR